MTTFPVLCLSSRLLKTIEVDSDAPDVKIISSGSALNASAILSLIFSKNNAHLIPYL